MLSSDFYGKKAFIWWCGVCEVVDDPQYNGCYQVRIFGVHDTDSIPKSQLPWAQSVTSVKAKPGDWVFGFFQDGDAAQIPVVLGVFSGVENHVNLPGKKYTPPPAAGFYDTATSAEVEQRARLPEHIVGRLPGEPSTFPRLSYGNLSGTGIQSTNSNLQYSCDILGIIQVRKGFVRLKTSELLNSVRSAIQELLSVLGLDPTGMISKTVSLLKQLTNILQTINEFIQDVREALRLVNQVLGLINCIVNTIKNLPSILARQVQQCVSNIINEFVQGAAGAFAAIIPTEFIAFFQESNKLLTNSNLLSNELTQTLVNGQATVQNISTIPESIEINSEAAVTSLQQFSSTLIVNTTNQFKENTLGLMTMPISPPQDYSNTANSVVSST